MKSSLPNYGLIGLGNLGSKLAKRLLEAGFSLKVFDLNAKSIESAVSIGASAVDSPTEAATDVAGLITCLASPDQSFQVLGGESGAFKKITPGSTWIEMSTVGVDDIIKLSNHALEYRVHTLEVPVTGGIHKAITGEITLFVGGESEILEQHRTALQTMAKTIIHLGKIGNASLVKVITNMLCLIDLVAAGEAMMLAKKGGIDLAQFYEAVCASSGNSVEFEAWSPTILNGTYNTGFTTELALKDLNFVMDLGELHGVPMKLTRMVKDLFEASGEKYGYKSWSPHVVKMLEDELGEKLRASGIKSPSTG